MDYPSIIRTIIEPLVENPSALLIREMPGENKKQVTIIIVAENADTARLIGRRGAIADSLREVISIAGKQDGTRVYLKFESFNENKETSEE